MRVDTESRITRTGTQTRTRTQTVTRYTSTSTGFVEGSVFWGRRLARSVVDGIGSAVTWLRETILPAGWLFVALALVGTIVGATAGWVEAWTLAVIATVLIVVSLPFLLGGHDYRVGLTLEKDRVVAGTDITARLSVVNQAARISLPGVLDIPVGEGLVEVNVPLLFANAEHREELTIGAQRRGVIDVGPITIGRGDPLGILRREVSWPQVERIHVHPVTVRIPSTSSGLIKDLEGTPTRDIVDSDLAFHAIREYAPGDSRRHIHWKSTAKTGTLMVRQYEETRRASIAVVLDLNTEEYASEEEFEMMVSAAASLAVQGVRDGRDVFISASSPVSEFSRGVVQSIQTLPTVTARTLLDGMSAIEGSDAAYRLDAVTSLTAQTFPALSIAFLCTGSVMSLDRLRGAALQLPVNVSAVAVRADPGAEPRLGSVSDLTVLTIGALDDLKHLIARGAIA
ncbi:MAG: DUF58 domain-containing protein [Cryobacterium sp.]|nr:DUF58 domain-containing protein [Cryobacterium sp.]